MALTQATIDGVKDRASIVAVIQESLPSLKRTGRTWKACCPFHKEKTPSFHVNPDRQWFHCFGCGESGGVIDYLIKHDGLTFPEAVRQLAERFGIPIEEDNARARDPERDRHKQHKDELHALLSSAAAYYETQLRDHPQRLFALEELSRRALTPDSEAVKDFRIGYAPPGWEGLATHLRQQGISPTGAVELGLLRPRQGSAGYYDAFRHRLMFPVLDAAGRVIAFSGRALAPIGTDVPADPPPKYINSPESPVYTKGHHLFGLHQARATLRATGHAILVEGNFDVVSLHARGFTATVAPLGTAFTEDQARLLARYATAVTVLFDGDAAGRKATLEAQAPLRQAQLFAHAAQLPDGADPDDYARTRGAPALAELLATARGLLEHALAQVSIGDTLEQRYARAERARHILSTEDDPLTLGPEDRIRRLAERLSIVAKQKT